MTDTNWYAYGVLLTLAGLGYWRSRRSGGPTPRDGGSHSGSAEGTDTAIIRIQAAGWIGVSPPLMKVHVDGQMVGILKDRSDHEFFVPAGRHEFAITRDWYRSETVALTVADGDRVDLVAGCRTRSAMAFSELASTAILGLGAVLVVLLPAVRRSAWLLAALGGFAMVPYLIGFARTFRPGGFVYLALWDQEPSGPPSVGERIARWVQ